MLCEDSLHLKTRDNIEADSGFSRAYLIMNLLSAVIASYGLLANSAAVVIGAMVIAMLLGPLSGIALALVDGNSSLLRRAFTTEISGVILVMTTAFIIGRIHWDVPFGHEILSRTSPNIMDLIIALAGGAAGAYATISPRISVSLVGVAVATALVPPLSVCGLCLARGDYRLALGGFLLFFANFVAIQFSYSLVFWLSGYHRLTTQHKKNNGFLFRNALSLTLLVALSIFLGLNFHDTIKERNLELKIRESLIKDLKSFPGADLAELTVSRETPGKVVILADVRTPYSLGPETVQKFEINLPSSRLPLELHIRSILTKEAGARQWLHLEQP